MKPYKRLSNVLISALLLSTQCRAQSQTTSSKTAPKKTHRTATHKETATERQIRELRSEMQTQIDALKAELATRDQQLNAAQQTAATAQTEASAATEAVSTANATATAASSSSSQNATQIETLNATVSDLKVADAGLQQTVITNQQDVQKQIESPTAIHYKGILIQPGGFLAAESVYRTRAMNSDINTPFNAAPYMNTAQAFTSEFNGTGRQSRLAVLVSSPLSWGKASGYYEMDFLSAGVTSNENQTNSYTARQREAWAQISTNRGFTMTGGQMWSLVTEVKKGINPVPGGENLPNTIDPQYHVGFSFTRQYALRFAQSFAGNKANLAFALEQGQTILAGTANAPNNFFFGAPGATGGLFDNGGNTSAQNYTNNVAPDVILKATFDPGYGHYEIGGVARFFRDRVYTTLPFSTTPSTITVNTPGTNFTTLGGGFFANLRFPATRFADIGFHLMQGAGTGRYGTSNLGDVTVRPNGLLEPLRNSQGLFSLETHPTKNLDFYGYAGGEYLQRTVYVAPTGVLVGYAPIPGENDTNCNKELPPTANSGYAPAAATCTGHTRAVLEGTAGMTYRLFNSPTKGRLQYQLVYSYLTREAWTGINLNTPTGLGAPKATNNMVFTGMRYYIP